MDVSPCTMVAVLSSGIGGSRFNTRLAQTVCPDRLAIVVNGADDRWCYGLRAALTWFRRLTQPSQSKTLYLAGAFAQTHGDA